MAVTLIAVVAALVIGHMAQSLAASVRHYDWYGNWLGWLDAQNVTGAQGQSFTFTWFARAGVEHVSARGIRWSVGAMFQHLSNGGQTDPNPGIDAVGLMIGWAWSF